MTLAAGDTVVAMDVVDDDRREVLIVTSQAFGKRTESTSTATPHAAVRASRRSPRRKRSATSSIKSWSSSDDELLMITSGNQVIRIPVSQIRRAGRSTKGVRLQRLAEGDEVIAIANLGQLSKRVSDVTGEVAEPS